MSDAVVELEWLTAERFRVGTTEFLDSYLPGSTAECFHIRKPRELVEAYVEMIRPFRDANVVELGIAQGGSAALMELVASPRMLVALELDRTPVAGLVDFIDRRGIGDRVHPHFGVDQGDRNRVREIVVGHLDGQPLDLVIDDASHLLEPTLASFETLFPLLRPGGRFLIEDWSWQYQLLQNLQVGLEQADPGVHDQFSEAIAARLTSPNPRVRAQQEADLAQWLPDPDARRQLIEFLTAEAASDNHDEAVPAAPPAEMGAKPDMGTESPLPALAIDLMLARATSGDVVADVHIDGHWIGVTRGPAELDPSTFRLADTFDDHLGLRFG